MGEWEQLEHLIHQDLAQDLGFGERHVILSLYEQLIYDGRTGRGRLARKTAQMRLATASDDDLLDLARYECHVCKTLDLSEALERLIKKREILRSGRLWR